MAKKTVNSDIYNLSQLVDDVKKLYLPDESDETLAIGLYGYIGALESHRLQTQVQMTGEMANEAFCSRSRLERNIITYAILADAPNINATPSKMAILLSLKESDIIDYLDSNNEFMIDRECPIYFGDYEFHLEYDIILKRIYDKSKSINTYSARYDTSTMTDREVPTSTIDITAPYLNPPVIIKENGKNYIYINTVISQVAHYTYFKKVITSNVIDNKTINFEFEDQLAYFEVEIEETDGTKYLQPVFDGSDVPDNAYKYYCWYQYIDTNLIRVRFDRNSYMPSLNCKINCLIKTTKGSEGNFKYSDSVTFDLKSSNYGYKSITGYVFPQSNAENGKDRKTKDELRKLIPKLNLARGSYTTISDLNNYFSMLDSEEGRIIIQKKRDNQIERLYYAYLVLKDASDNVIPTNTIDLKIGLEDLNKYSTTESLSDRYVLPSGSCIRLNEDEYGVIEHNPLAKVRERFFTTSVTKKGNIVTVKFKAKVTEDHGDKVSVGVSVGDCYTPILISPGDSTTTYVPNNSNPIVVEDGMRLSVGQKYKYLADFATAENSDYVIIRDSDLECLTFVEGSYTITYSNGNTSTESFEAFPLTFEKLGANTQISLSTVYLMNSNDNRTTTLTRNRKSIILEPYEYSIRASTLLYQMGIPSTTITKISSSDETVFKSVNENDEHYINWINKVFDKEVYIYIETGYGTFTITASQSHLTVNNNFKLSESSNCLVPPSTLVMETDDVFGTLLVVLDETAYTYGTTLVLPAIETTVEYNCYRPYLTHDLVEDPIQTGDVITYTLQYTSISNSETPEINLKLSQGLEYVIFSNMIYYSNGTSEQIEPMEIVAVNDDFLYTNPYAVVINGYHLYSAFYMMAMTENPYVQFEWVNDKSDVQFIGSNISWIRDFLGSENKQYRLNFTLTQSVQQDLGIFDESGTPHIKCVAVYYRDGKAYRYKTMTLTAYSDTDMTFTFSQDVFACDILDNDNNIKVEGVQPVGQSEDTVCTTEITCANNGKSVSLKNSGSTTWSDISEFFALFDIDYSKLVISSCESSDTDVFNFIYDQSTSKLTGLEMLRPFKNKTITITFTTYDGTDYTFNAINERLEYGFFNPTTAVKIYALVQIPNTDGGYERYDFDSICPLEDKTWTVTNIYNVANDGVTMYHNYSEIMGSRVEPYGDYYTDSDGNEVMNVEGYYIKSVPVIGYTYAVRESLIQSAIDALNYRKTYIDNSLIYMENSFGIDFKLFNTYGPSHIYYVIKDSDKNSYLDDNKEYISRTDLTFYFRVKLVASKDSYTKNNIIAEIKEYIEDLNDLGEIHIPNIITQITNNYSEQIDYFEYLGFNEYGPEVQHIFKEDDSNVDIHTTPEFINIHNSIDLEDNFTPDINIYLSEV